MGAAGDGGPVPDLYRLLGVPRGASSLEITHAWRRRALAEHPDRRPLDAAAPARFHALADAYQVLGDPARRAAYDRLHRDGPGSGTAAHQDRARQAPAGTAVPVTVRPAGRVPEPPLRAGPVWVDVPPPAAGPTAEDDAVWLAVRYLAGDEGWPW